MHVIHIIRDNVLKTLVSQLTADARGFYHSSQNTEATRVHGPIQGLHARLERIKSEGESWTRIFSGRNPYLCVHYEELVASPVAHINRILEFLQVEPAPLASPLRKLNPDHLAGTQFAECLS